MTGPDLSHAAPAGPPPGAPGHDPRRGTTAPVLLALAVAVAFLPAVGNDFVNWDDFDNFTANEKFRGLGWPQLRWAWTTFLMGVYQPLSWMVLSAEYAAWGLDPRGYHLVSVALHAANAALLYYLVLDLLARCGSGADRVVGARGWAGLAVAAFALHPLRAEPVAWASCQPYMPAAFFFLLAVLAYLRAAAAAGASRRGWLAAALGLHAAALLSKAVAVSLPAVLLVLDAYPLGRLGGGRRSWRVWLEKLPFAALSLVFVVVAVKAKDSYGALTPLQSHGTDSRVAQSCYGVWFYLIKTVAPFPLMAYYELPARMSWSDPGFLPYVVATAAVTAAAVAMRRRRPWLLATWSAYLLVLAPNLGIVAIGRQIAADRYSYLAMMAWVPLLAAGLGRLGRGGPGRPPRAAVAGAGVAVCAALTALTWRQCEIWQDSATLFHHAIAHTEGGRSPVLYNNAGLAFFGEARFDEAMEYFQEAIRIDPNFLDAINNMGMVLERRGRTEDARACFRKAIAADPLYLQSRKNLIHSLLAQDRLDDAESELKDMLHHIPDDTYALTTLAGVYGRTQRLDQAVGLLKEALRVDPGLESARRTLGELSRRGLR